MKDMSIKWTRTHRPCSKSCSPWKRSWSRIIFDPWQSFCDHGGNQKECSYESQVQWLWMRNQTSSLSLLNQGVGTLPSGIFRPSHSRHLAILKCYQKFGRPWVGDSKTFMHLVVFMIFPAEHMKDYWEAHNSFQLYFHGAVAELRLSL